MKGSRQRGASCGALHTAILKTQHAAMSGWSVKWLRLR
jgi:hypothetical protein